MLLLHAFLLASNFKIARGFTFSMSTPTQCDNLVVSWTGGQAPFELMILPALGSSKNISIPPSAVQGDKGSFKTLIDRPKGTKLLLSMSDATGFATGGVSDLLVVGDSVSGANCNTTDPGIDFEFSLDGTLQECSSFTFGGYTGAIQPVTMVGYVPDGQAFTFNPPKGPTSYGWPANIKAGTSVIFCMHDSQGQNGGCSNVEVATLSTNESCLSTITSSTATQTPARSEPTRLPEASTPKDPTSSSQSRKAQVGLPTGAIAGIAAGGGVLVIAVVVIVSISVRRRRKGGEYKPSRTKGVKTPPCPQAYYPSPYHVSHFVTPASETSISHTFKDSRYGDSPMSLDTRGSRAIVHTDIPETPTDYDAVELPPHYTPNHTPLPGIPGASTSPNPKRSRVPRSPP